MSDRWLDIDQYADLLGVPRTWVRDKVTSREIQHRRVGRHVRFAPEDITANNEKFFEPAITATPSRAAGRVRSAARTAAKPAA
ncbi:helix-turn-helix domain-containing protein [Micromonospora chersina]|uniref:helix-turn-helix domain-containing protein n=1 Tax=Micromonospora chersina TaxID=47854 RepID=UPI00371AF5E6